MNVGMERGIYSQERFEYQKGIGLGENLKLVEERKCGGRFSALHFDGSV